MRTLNYIEIGSTRMCVMTLDERLRRQSWTIYWAITCIFNASGEVHLVLTLTAKRSYTIVGVEGNQGVSGEGLHRLQRNTFQER